MAKTKRIYRLLLILVTFAGMPSAFLQAQTPSDLNLTVGGLVGFRKINDDAVGPTRYRGLITGLSAGLEKEKTKSLSSIQFQGHTVLLFPKNQIGAKTGRVRENGFEFYYQYLRKGSERGSKSITTLYGMHIGSLIRVRNHNKLGNSARIFDNFNQVGLSGGFMAPVEILGKPSNLRFMVHVPVQALAIRPSFTNLRDFLNLNNSELRSRIEEHGFVGPGNFRMMRTELRIDFPLKEKSALAVGYHWEFYDYRKVNPIQAAMHQMNVQYRFALK